MTKRELFERLCLVPDSAEITARVLDPGIVQLLAPESDRKIAMAELKLGRPWQVTERRKESERRKGTGERRQTERRTEERRKRGMKGVRNELR